ncbi:hypothetical protein DITRI_Ditri16bG0115300 [Diplodiscus trichospermus]
MASAPIADPLPEDIVGDIMARLPVKSLKRFRCVDKSWCCLIESPQFISAHYSISKNKVNPLLKHRKHEDQKEVLSIISDQTLDIVANLDIPSFTDVKTCVYIQGYCNGIICLWYPALDVVLLWNIATKEIKTLPKCPFESPPDFNNSVDVLCLGYDSKRNDYKVIRIDIFWKKGFDYEDPRSLRGKGVALYNLSTDCWRKLNADLTVVEFTEFCLSTGGSQFYLNGYFHCEASIEDETVLFSFDMSSEVFITTPLPDGANNSFFYFMEISGVVGGICKRHDFLVRNSDYYDAWVLSEVGLKNSWIKLFTVGPMFHITPMPLCVGSDGKVFFSDFDNFLVWHHPSNRMIKTLQIQGYYLEVVMYAESLVSLRGGNAFNN